MKKILILSIIPAVAFMGCTRKTQQAEHAEATMVTTVISVEREYIPVLTFPGNVLANKEANLGATLPGKIEKMHCSEGSEVKKGDLLAELSGELLTQAMVEHDVLQKDFERIARLKEKGSISQIEYDHLKAKLDASVAKVEMMRKNTQVIAPFAGTVVDIMVNEGENYSMIPAVDAQNLTVNSGILKIIQLNPVRVAVEVNEKDLSQVKSGQTADILVDAYPEKTFTGEVRYIRPMLSALSRTARVEIEIPNPGYLLKPGMFAHVTLRLPETKGVFIPLEAIFHQSGTSEDFVFQVTGNKVKKVAVRQRQSEKDMVLVEGIPANTRLAAGGKTKLSDGSEIAVKTK